MNQYNDHKHLECGLKFAPVAGCNYNAVISCYQTETLMTGDFAKVKVTGA